jgi:hypothetical protein
MIHSPVQANPLDSASDGRKALYMSRAQLQLVLGPITTKAKLAEIRRGDVVLEDVLPTTFNAIAQWLNGKAILHTIPAAIRNKTLRELAYIYILAARLGHRAIVHDCVNNMPRVDSPFEFLETCALVYKRGCAGVAFRNFFRKNLPIILETTSFDHTDRVGALLQESSELATDFAETMVGVMRQAREPAEIHGASTEPFPSLSNDARQQTNELCSCGLHDCTCTFETASIVRPLDTQNIPRRSGYVETAPPSDMGDSSGWDGPVPWVQHDDSAGWDYLHRPVPSGSAIPGRPLSNDDAEDWQPIRPRDWSSAHIGHNANWADVAGEEESLISGWDEGVQPPAPNWTPASNQWQDSRSSRPRSRPGSGALVPADGLAKHAADLEARLRNVEQQLNRANTRPAAANINRAGPGELARKGNSGSSSTAKKLLATSNMPPAPLLHPGVPPEGMPNYVPGYGYNRYVQIGNGVVHPTGPGPYGLAGRSMIAVRNSDPMNCTLSFRAGELIECVVPCEEGRSTSQHQPWNHTGQRMQGICRTQAGSFPAEYVREAHGAAVPSAGVPHGVFHPQAASTGPKVAAPINAGLTRTNTAPTAPAANAPATTPTQTTAANVDHEWLQKATPSGRIQPQPAPQNRPGRLRRSSTNTAASRRKHLPGCPSELAPWASCNCPVASQGPPQWQSTPRYDNVGSWDTEDDGNASISDFGGLPAGTKW